MDQFNEAVTKLQKKFLNNFRNYLDPGYFVLTAKQNPLSNEEESFLQVYQNTVCLHFANIFFTFPAMVYYYHYFRASRATPVDLKRLSWAKNRMLFFVPLAFASMTTAYAYEKTNNFQSRLKEIEQFYLDHKDADINTISFSYANLPSA